MEPSEIKDEIPEAADAEGRRLRPRLDKEKYKAEAEKKPMVGRAWKAIMHSLQCSPWASEAPAYVKGVVNDALSQTRRFLAEKGLELIPYVSPYAKPETPAEEAAAVEAPKAPEPPPGPERRALRRPAPGTSANPTELLPPDCAVCAETLPNGVVEVQCAWKAEESGRLLEFRMKLTDGENADIEVRELKNLMSKRLAVYWRLSEIFPTLDAKVEAVQSEAPDIGPFCEWAGRSQELFRLAVRAFGLGEQERERLTIDLLAEHYRNKVSERDFPRAPKAVQVLLLLERVRSDILAASEGRSVAPLLLPSADE